MNSSASSSRNSHSIIRRIDCWALLLLALTGFTSFADARDSSSAPAGRDSGASVGGALPSHQFARVWSVGLEAILKSPESIRRIEEGPKPGDPIPIPGIGWGNWNLDGKALAILATSEGNIVLLDASGGMAGARKAPKELGLEGSRFHFPPQWTEIEKGRGALFLLRSGWPDRLDILGPDGRALWHYPEKPGWALSIDSAAWADLDGDGAREALIGFSGDGGVRAISSKGRGIWSNREFGSVWSIAGFDAQPGRPGMAVIADSEGAAALLDAKGKTVRRLSKEGEFIAKLAAAEMRNDGGDRQILAIVEGAKGAKDYAAAMDLEGVAQWKHPVISDEMDGQSPEDIQACDMDGDGRKEWVLRPRRGELVVLDAEGKLVARLATPVAGWTTWGVLPMPDGKGRILCAGLKEVAAFELGD